MLNRINRFAACRKLQTVPLARWLLLSAAVLVLPVAAHAERDLDRAEALLAVVGMEQVIASRMEQTLDHELQMNPTLVPFRPILVSFFNKHMSYESVKPDIVRIYAKAFTDSELDAMTRFFSTPVGQKALVAMPEVQRQGAELATKRVEDNLPELFEELQAAAKEMEKQDNPHTRSPH